MPQQSDTAATKSPAVKVNKFQQPKQSLLNHKEIKAKSIARESPGPGSLIASSNRVVEASTTVEPSKKESNKKVISPPEMSHAAAMPEDKHGPIETQ